jgi:nucleotide-binding universal stress UspA family protein
MKKIIVATDFSPAASNAAKYAAHMAMAINADLILLHVYSIPIIYNQVPAAVSASEIRIAAEENMSELRAHLKTKTRDTLQIDTEIRMGAFYQELKIVCEYIHPYAVLMGSQGTSATERLLFGSHAVHAMTHLQWPLITVPPKASFSSVKKIGLACDLNKIFDHEAIDEIKMLVQDFNAELHVLNTGKEKILDPNTIFEPGMLQEMLEGLRPVYEFIGDNNTDEGILQFAQEKNIDLLLVLPKRHSFLEAMIHKSHTKHFVLHSHVPVMALHQVN